MKNHPEAPLDGNTVATGKTSVFSGNTDSSGNNSIYFVQGEEWSIIFNYQLNINTIGTGLLDMQDPMRGGGEYANIEITKTGTGTWRLAGNNVLTGAGFSVEQGTFHLGNGSGTAAQLNLGNGTFTLANSATLTFDTGSSMTAAAFDLRTGSQLRFNTTNAVAGGTALLSLNTNTPGLTIVGSNVYVTSPTTPLTNGQSIVLAQTNGTFTVAGNLYVNGTLATPFVRSTAGTLYNVLTTNAA